MSKISELKSKLSEKVKPLKERFFPKKAQKAVSNGPLKRLLLAYSEGSTWDRVLVLAVCLFFIFGVYSLTKATTNLLKRDLLISKMFDKKRTDPASAIFTAMQKEADFKKSIGSTVSLNQIKINYNKDNGKSGFISISLWVKCDSPSTAERVENGYPLLHDAIISKIQTVNENEITTESGKKKIQEQMLLAMNSVLTRGKIERVYFHNMVFE